MNNLEQEIQRLKARNQRVEKDKAWETSGFRKVVIAVLTYVVVLVFFVVAELPDPYVSALVPSLAFVLSTLSLGIFRKIWEKI